jgi:hypothetical protein
MFGHCQLMAGVMPSMQDAGMNTRMQGLDPSVEHLRKTSKVFNGNDRDTSLSQGLGGSTG